MDSCFPGGREEWGEVANGYGVPLWGDRNIPELDSDDGCKTLRMSSKPLTFVVRVL